jgi:acyl carrier protein phosphodiesterase
MNYLAHAYLSFEDTDVLAGNMMSDYVKGKTQYTYRPSVQRGIRLHRAIDAFTDQHEATRNIAALFKPHYRLYSGAFTDIVYDYFLANDVQCFPTEASLLAFTERTYAALSLPQQQYPPMFKRVLPYMMEQNWLYHYRSNEGIQKSMAGMVRRALYLSESEVAFNTFVQHKTYIREQYDLFFPNVKKFAIHTLQQL